MRGFEVNRGTRPSDRGAGRRSRQRTSTGEARLTPPLVGDSTRSSLRTLVVSQALPSASGRGVEERWERDRERWEFGSQCGDDVLTRGNTSTGGATEREVSSRSHIPMWLRPNR